MARQVALEADIVFEYVGWGLGSADVFMVGEVDDIKMPSHFFACEGIDQGETI